VHLLDPRLDLRIAAVESATHQLSSKVSSKELAYLPGVLHQLHPLAVLHRRLGLLELGELGLQVAGDV